MDHHGEMGQEVTNRDMPSDPRLFGIEWTKRHNSDNWREMPPDDPDLGDDLIWDANRHRYVYLASPVMSDSPWCDQDCVNDDAATWANHHNSDK
jgi:hypothetical protein